MNRATGSVPSANRGLKSPSVPQSCEANPVDSLCIDYLKFSSDLVCTIRNTATGGNARMLETAAEHADTSHHVARHLFAHFFGDCVGLTLDTKAGGYKNFYEYHQKITAEGGQICGFVAFGGAGQNGTFCIELTGAGCAHVVAWDSLQRKLESAAARLTRVDVAYDDFRGVRDLALAEAMYEAGAFITNGRPPASQKVGWNDESGHTLYVGKNTGNQQLCVYEKGKQLGDAQSRWVRWEARFGAKYRVIPLDILTNAASYMLGHFPALHWVATASQRMRTHIERAASELRSAMRWCKHQYGGLLEVIRRACPDVETFGRTVDLLTKNKLPIWAAQLPHGHHTRPVAVHLCSA